MIRTSRGAVAVKMTRKYGFERCFRITDNSEDLLMVRGEENEEL